MTPKKLQDARMNIAGFLKNRRIELGLTQPDIAEKTGLGLMTIKRMEDAKFWPGLKQYLLICDALELTFILPEQY